MKIFVALLLLVALVAAPVTVEFSLVDAASLPWRTFSETVGNVVNVQPGSCAGEQILRVHLERDGRTFMYFAAENGRYLFAELVNDKPVMIHIGSQLPAPEHDVIKVHSHQYNSDRDGGGPCGHLFPKTS